MAAVTCAGSSSGSGVSGGGVSISVVGVGDALSSIPFVGRTGTSVDFTFTDVDEGGGADSMLRSGILQAPRSKAANVSKMNILIF
jgi:hypothetical protein